MVTNTIYIIEYIDRDYCNLISLIIKQKPWRNNMSAYNEIKAELEKIEEESKRRVERLVLKQNTERTTNQFIKDLNSIRLEEKLDAIYAGRNDV